MVENIARVGAEGKVIALIRFLCTAKRAASAMRARHPCWTAAGTSGFAMTGAAMVMLPLPLLWIGVGSFNLWANANCLAQAQVQRELRRTGAEI